MTFPSTSWFSQIKSTRDLGSLIRRFRKQRHLTLEKVSGLTNTSTRFLSELERGKETAEIGKVISTLNKLGLEIIIQPRGTKNLKSKPMEISLNDDKS